MVRFPITTRKLFLALFSLFFSVYGQSPDFEARIRAPVWIYIEPVPGHAASDEDKPEYRDIDELARWITAGMIYGWKYEYSPSDRRRNVQEYFTLTPQGSIPEDDPSYSLTDLSIEYPRVSAWAQYTPNDTVVRWKRFWSSVTIQSGKGRGTGERIDGAAGIKAAYTNALKQAVREYARTLEKNKPREIHGEILIRDNPRLYPDAGRFVAEVSVSLTIREIIPWSIF